jgi:S-DNA-T family DNA segregation ATPase FtsK/SpoIIIE
MSEYDLAGRSHRNGAGASSRVTSNTRANGFAEDFEEGFTYPQEAEDPFFDSPETVRNARRLSIPPEPNGNPPAVRRTRGARQMPKRLSEELEEQETEAQEEEKPRRSRRKYSKKESGEQIPLELRTKAKKPDNSVKQRQVLGVSLIMAAILIVLAIISYSALDAAQAETRLGDLPAIFFRNDPGVNALADTAHNWLGLLGAMMANFFINKTIGYASIIFPFLLGAWSLAFFRFTTKQRRKLTVATSFILITAVLFCATIGTTQLIQVLPHLDHEWAGAVGQFLGLSFTRLIGSIGSLIIFATSFVVMLVFSIDLDVERTFMRGRDLYKGFSGMMRMKIIEFWEKREVKREEKLRLKQELQQEIDGEAQQQEETIVVKEPIAVNGKVRSKEISASKEEEKREVEAIKESVVNIPPAVKEFTSVEELNPVRDIISIRRESTNGAEQPQPEERTPFLKVRPAPKQAEKPVIARISRTEGEMLGGTVAKLAKLSGGAIGSPATPRSKRILPTDIEERETPPENIIDSRPSYQDEETAFAEEAPVIPLEQKLITEEPSAEVMIGDKTILGDEVLPHSAEEPAELRDIVKEHQTASREAVKEVRKERDLASPTLFGEDKPFVPENPYTENLSKYHSPSLEFLSVPDEDDEFEADSDELTAKGRLLRDKLATFGVEIENITVTPGPVVTLYEFTPAEGVKVSAVGNLTDDIALAMKARGIRIIAPMPGRGTIGIEIPNDHPKMVRMRSMLSSPVFTNSKMNLPLALGKTISGDVYVDDLSKMPHLLIAGATGSGKSVGVNGIIASLLYAKSPRDVKFVVVDPKKIELSLYKALRNHFLIVSPEAGGEEIVTTPQYAVLALKALEIEMERRYDRLAKAAVRSLADYNTKVAHGKLRSTSEEQHYHLPYIVVIIDELADLMITAAREIEEPICRLAQMARAVGIHLILATQRPSVDVITGVIKANFPARIAYQVATKVDSRTILDTMGAEQLLGNGDMLYLPSGTPKPIRLQAPYISTEEVEAVVEAVAVQQGQGCSYSRPWTLPSLKQKGGAGGTGNDGDHDELFEEAAWTVFRHQQASTSMLQRRLKIGYSRAARIVDELEHAGIVGSGDGSKAREVLIENEEEMELVLRNI